ncbi:Protein MAIN-LIKE 1 [Glycine soja]|uniref:Protein MAIN-LIKE 1 n=1 Tax=Glycine soja TaxID=3848 RepID=A0A445HB24_GLYSO|nr:Protein MAIN-LIKE 1 [Glycine soja]
MWNQQNQQQCNPTMEITNRSSFKQVSGVAGFDGFGTNTTGNPTGEETSFRAHSKGHCFELLLLLSRNLLLLLFSVKLLLRKARQGFLLLLREQDSNLRVEDERGEDESTPEKMAKKADGGVFRKTRYGFFRKFRKNIFRKVSGRSVLPEVTKRLPEDALFQKNFLEEVVLPELFRKIHFFRKIMTRTRGLGRAIGRVVGRDRATDEDAGDVPERRRPTASARRLRVHQMTTEGRDMAEDVADMTDDVPEQPTEAPEMRADAQGADSGEGSDGDDVAEGFPGGPRDPSVLTSFAEHVAHAVWSGQERPDLKLVSHGRKVTLIGRPVPEIEGLVAATGLSPLIDCSVITGDPRLISAFVERWHSETSTFHLPVGELTITLDDVSSILHLPITGALHSFHALSTEEAIFLLTELLEVSAEEARAETALTRGAYVRLGWVRDIYETRCQPRRWIVAARAYLLHLVGCTLFANKSATYVHVVHLDAFRDLTSCIVNLLYCGATVGIVFLQR